MVEEENLATRLQELVAENEAYAFVLDYALFGSRNAANDGSFEGHAEIIPGFKESLATLVKEGIVKMKTGSRYTGATTYFEVTTNRATVIECLDSFYKKLKENVELLSSMIPSWQQDFYSLYEDGGKVSCDEKQYSPSESLYRELVKKGLMLSWNRVTKRYRYRCYVLREEPFNCLGKFSELMEERLSGFVRKKIGHYLQGEMAAKLDFLLGFIEAKSSSAAESYMKQRGWSERLVWEARKALEQEKMLPRDATTSLFKFVEDRLSDKIDAIDEIVQVKKPRELTQLYIKIRQENVLGKVKIQYTDIAKALESLLPKLERKKVEVLRIESSDNKFEVVFSCNRLLYVIRAEESDVYSIPTIYADRFVVIGKNVLDYAFNEYVTQQLWPNSMLMGYEDHILLGDIDADALFRFLYEEMRQNDILFAVPMGKINDYFAKTAESLKRSLTLNEGFVFTEPYNPWPLQQEFLGQLREATKSLKLCVPYPDSSTFSFLATVPKQVSIQLLILSDKRELKERKENRVDVEVLNRTVRHHRVEIRRNPEIHVRFIIVDSQGVMFSSSDLKDPDLRRKYQYGFWTNNEPIVKRVIEYFETLWSNSTPVDLYTELEA